MANDTLTTSEKAGTSSAGQHPITAVDIVLEPDATMIQQAQAANAGLLKNFPNGFALGAEHVGYSAIFLRSKPGRAVSCCKQSTG